jgi:PPOX class probable F420-dependent enzyme
MPDLKTAYVEILSQRRIASVATTFPDGTPHLTAVWFVFDGDSFLLAIPSSSVKAGNLRANANLAVMVDVRREGHELGVSVSGKAEILEGQAARDAISRVHEKYLTRQALSDPQVGPLFSSFDDMAVRLTPTRWITWDLGALDQQVFGGKLAAKSYLKPLQS